MVHWHILLCLSVLLHEFLVFGDGHGLCQQGALNLIAAGIFQDLILALSLHTLADHMIAKPSNDVYKLVQEKISPGIVLAVLDKGPVHFYRVHRNVKD